MDTVISYNDHGVMICSRTERTDMPVHTTRIRFQATDGSFPIYRQRGTFGMNDGGDAA